ncbi:glycosyltransferase family 4 protein [Microbacterium sp. CPCC 204701]|uniref:glycosyltransferase family 4 protein n=1 Tax=Microbacterium sp. CPCC 204701 TaxID=2493084 RepID=UPI000FD8570C|nr:glycosyltransferase family 1 protein [Microbacterium sp. CPCC 204701]
MRILVVAPQFEEEGRGIAGIVRSVIAGAAAAGHEVGVLTGFVPDGRDPYEQAVEYLASGDSTILSQAGGLKNGMILAVSQGLRGAPLRRQVIRPPQGEPNRLFGGAAFVLNTPLLYLFFHLRRLRIFRWLVRRAARKAGVDLVIAGAPLPLAARQVRPARLAQVMYDFMPLELSEIGEGTRERFRQSITKAIRGSDFLFSISRDTSAKVRERRPDARIYEVYGVAHPVGAPVPEPEQAAILDNELLEPGRYLLFISALETRKNLVRLMDAFRIAHPRIGMPLVIVGSPGESFAEIDEHYRALRRDVRQDIVFTGRVSEAKKHVLLANCNAVVFPSLYEGLGLPVLEGLAYGKPVVTSRVGALPEAGGEAALYLTDPRDTDELADALVRIVTDADLRASLTAHAADQVAFFTQERFTERVAAALNAESGDGRRAS